MRKRLFTAVLTALAFILAGGYWYFWLNHETEIVEFQLGSEGEQIDELWLICEPEVEPDPIYTKEQIEVSFEVLANPILEQQNPEIWARANQVVLSVLDNSILEEQDPDLWAIANQLFDSGALDTPLEAFTNLPFSVHLTKEGLYERHVFRESNNSGQKFYTKTEGNLLDVSITSFEVETEGLTKVVIDRTTGAFQIDQSRLLERLLAEGTGTHEIIYEKPAPPTGICVPGSSQEDVDQRIRAIEDQREERESEIIENRLF